MRNVEQTESPAAALARIRWDNATAEERHEQGRKMAEGRAAKKRAGANGSSQARAKARKRRK